MKKGKKERKKRNDGFVFSVYFLPIFSTFVQVFDFY